MVPAGALDSEGHAPRQPERGRVVPGDSVTVGLAGATPLTCDSVAPGVARPGQEIP